MAIVPIKIKDMPRTNAVTSTDDLVLDQSDATRVIRVDKFLEGAKLASKDTLASAAGASTVGTSSGETVQESLDGKQGRIAQATTIRVPEDYPTLFGALDSLKAKSFTGIPVTISIADGSYDSSTILLSHPDLEFLTVEGRSAPVAVPVSAGSVVSGAAGLWVYQFTVPSGHGIQVGDIVGSRDFTGGYGISLLYGALRVVAVTETTVSVNIRYYGTSFPTLTISSGSLWTFKTKLNFNKTDGIVVRGGSLGLMQNLAIVGNMWDYWSESDVTGTEVGSHGIYVSSNTIINGAATPGGQNPNAIAGGSISVKWCAVLDFDQQGVCAANAGSAFCRYLFSSSNGRRGFYAGNVGSIDARQCVASHNYRDGVISDYGGAFNTSGFWASGNRLDGLFSINNGSMIAPNTTCEYNLQFGGEARAGSYLTVDAGTIRLNGSGGLHGEFGAAISCLSAVISNNNVDGIQAYYGTSVRATGATLQDNVRYNINALDSSVACTPDNISNAGTSNYFNQDSVINLGTTYVPKTEVASNTALSVVDTNQTHKATMALSSIGDYVLAVDGTTRLTTKANVLYAPDGVMTVGRDADRMLAIFARQLFFGTTGTQRLLTGTGSPEGGTSAPVGSIYMNLSGGAGTTMYVKETGTGNTGWAAK